MLWDSNGQIIIGEWVISLLTDSEGRCGQVVEKELDGVFEISDYLVRTCPDLVGAFVFD
jgi:hypothetical protein